MELKRSREAEQDLFDIYLYGYKNFGEEQAEDYLRSLEGCFESIADHPRIGRARPDIDPLIRSLEHNRHIIFYDLYEDHILVVRILHKKMDAKRHL